MRKQTATYQCDICDRIDTGHREDRLPTGWRICWMCFKSDGDEGYVYKKSFDVCLYCNGRSDGNYASEIKCKSLFLNIFKSLAGIK